MAGSSGTRKKRRVRSPHSGVVLEAPAQGHPCWRARFTDPETGRVKKVRLDPLVISTAEARREWAIRKSKELARERMELAVGGPRIVRKPLVDATTGFFAAAEHRLKENTIELYQTATDLFLAWAKSAGIVSTDALTAAKLPGFRDYLLARRKQGYVKGGKRGARKPSKAKLSPLTINWQLRAVKTVLNDLRTRGTVQLSRDAIADALKPVAALREAPEFLMPAECQRLLEAALRHDGDVFAATREEHAGLRPLGTTHRYEPIAPFVATTLITGMRFGEVLALKWSDVQLDALDSHGQVVGEIRLRATATKTGHARTIGLGVSPQLRAMLAAMKLRAGNAVYVFGDKEPMSRAYAEAARRRLVGTYGAPAFSWQLLRSTCATVGCNAPSVLGDGAAFISAKRLGHSITVSEKHYAGIFQGIPRDATTLEAAMQIGKQMDGIVDGDGTMPGGQQVRLRKVVA